MPLFCFGLGYTALALARRLIAEGWSIAGTTRTAERRARLAAEGFEVHLFDRDRPLPDPAAALAGTTHLLTSIPPDESGDPVLDHHLADLRRCATLRWVGYLGTTGVYGDRGGAWVSEADAAAPTMTRTRRRAAAEAGWLASELPVHIFRLAGIYGPGAERNALERQLLRPVGIGASGRRRKGGRQVAKGAFVGDGIGELHLQHRAPFGRLQSGSDDLGDAEEAESPVEECRHRDLVGGVEHRG